MSKFTKAVSLTIGFILLFLMATLMLTHAVDAFMPAYLKFFQLAPRLDGYFKGLIATYVFWVALVLFVIILVAMLVIAFYPRTRTEVGLQDSDGQLLLKKSAIEGLVKSVVEQHGYMKNPKVTAKLYKRKFKVRVKGDIIPRFDAAQKAELIKADIEQNLKHFIGLNKPMQFKVQVSGVRRDKVETESSRVQ